jgi:large subunit ribosomal protein L15
MLGGALHLGKHMKLHELKNVKGAVHRKKRVGCGEGSGHGKTSGRGGKGQSARSGSSIRPGFEGGQMPLYRKLPHRGFNQAAFRNAPEVVNIGEFAKLGDVKLLKVLGTGELTRAFKVTATSFSDTAKAKIEAAGGQAIVA